MKRKSHHSLSGGFNTTYVMIILPYAVFHFALSTAIFSRDNPAFQHPHEDDCITLTLTAAARKMLESTFHARVSSMGLVPRHVILPNRSKLLFFIPRIRVWPHQTSKPYTSVVLPDFIVPRHQHCARSLLIGMMLKPISGRLKLDGRFDAFLQCLLYISDYDRIIYEI